MTTLATIHAQHIVSCYAMAARLSTGTDTLAERLASVRALVGEGKR